MHRSVCDFDWRFLYKIQTIPTTRAIYWQKTAVDKNKNEASESLSSPKYSPVLLRKVTAEKNKREVVGEIINNKISVF